jgi:hypothetical protein
MLCLAQKPQTPRTIPNSQTLVLDDPKPEGDGDDRNLVALHHHRIFMQRAAVRLASHCSVGKCFCSCHDTMSIKGRFWSANVPSIFQGKCSRASCINAQRLSLWISLTQLGIPIAVTVGLDMFSSVGKYQITPSLGFQRVVKKTSPGFILLWKLETGQELDWVKARKELLDLFHEGKASPLDVDRDGETWLEVSLQLLLILLCIRISSDRSLEIVA